MTMDSTQTGYVGLERLRIALVRAFAVVGALAASLAPFTAADPPRRLNVAGLGALEAEVWGSASDGVSAVSPAGDVDGDGLEDLLIRFSRAQVTGSVAYDHVVLLYGFGAFGGPLDALDPSVRKTVTRTYATELGEVGATGVAGGEDVNGDGVPDLVIASVFEETVEGEALLLILGGELPEEIDGSSVGISIPGSVILFEGQPFGEPLGARIGLTGDMDGDGLGEIYLWSRGSTGGSRLHVLFGQTELPPVIDASRAGGSVPGFVLEVGAEELMTRVGSLGDVNGDGLSDLAISITRSMPSAPSVKEHLMLPGRPDFPEILHTSDAAEVVGRRFRGFEAIESAGDVDGDGRAELLLTYQEQGMFAPLTAFLIDGRDLESLPSIVERGTLDDHPPRAALSVAYDVGVRGSGPPRLSLTRGRDLDGDGRAETLLGHPGHDVSDGVAIAARAGTAYIVRGGTEMAGVATAPEAAQQLGVEIDGIETEGHLGDGVYLLGDMTGDGKGEILIASLRDHCLTPGLAAVAWELHLISGEVLEPALPLQLGRIYPTTGSMAGGDSVLLLGTGFGDQPRVFFGAEEAASVDVLGSGVLVARSPAAPLAARVDVHVEAGPERSTLERSFQYELDGTLRLDRETGRVLRIASREAWTGTLRGAVVCDFNGDSRPDAAVIGNGEDPFFGELCVVFGQGRREEMILLEGIEPPRGTVARLTSGWVSTGLSSGGDLDSDGKDDLVVRVSEPNPQTGQPRTEWLLVFGGDSFPLDVPLQEAPGTVRVPRATDTFLLGASAIVEDVTGDDVDDLLLSGVDPGQVAGTLLYIVKGWQERPDQDLDLAQLVATGGAACLSIDLIVDRIAGTVGDFNGDHVADFFFGGSGALQEGVLVIGYGGTPIFTGQTFTLSRGFFGDSGGLLIAGSQLTSGAYSSAAAADLDADGDMDLFQYFDDPEACGLAPRAGGGFVLDYAAALRGTSPEDFPQLIWEIYGAKQTGRPDFVPAAPGEQKEVVLLANSVAAEGLGRSAAPAGDFDGDGFDDLVLGAPGIPWGAPGVSTGDPVAGSVQIFRGGPRLHEEPTVHLPGSASRAIRMVSDEGTGLGAFVAGGFDWDRDGTSDVLIGSRDLRAYVVFGERVQEEFIRGDSDSDGELTITDAVAVLMYLFLGGMELPCADAADANDDGIIEITDAIYVLNYLFLGGAAPPEPYPDPGLDPTADGLRCRS